MPASTYNRRADLWPSVVARNAERTHDAAAEHHSPEESVALLRAELDACRGEIERQRRIIALADDLAVLASAACIMLAHARNTRTALRAAIDHYAAAIGVDIGGDQ